ncbi:surface antigen-like protein [Leishmania guyanensis]
MRCREALAAAVVVACMVIAPATAYTTEQCRELSRCDVGGTFVYSFSEKCVCCPEPPTGSILPVQCAPSTPLCPSVSHCKACDTTVGRCDVCVSGYVLEPITSSCTQCLASMCDICQSDSEGKRCQLCSEGYYWTNGGECYPVSSSMPAENTQCRVAFCSTCATAAADTCIKCADGYTTDSKGFCVNQCTIQNCDMCYTDNAADCQLCSTESTWSTTGCLSGTSGCRIGHCTTCLAGDHSTCVACESGYTLSAGYCFSSKSCADANCVSCPSDPGTCTQCKPNYFLTPLFTCSEVPCSIENCMQCDPQNPSRCQKCVAPYEVDSYDGLCRLSDTCAVPNCKMCAAGTSRLCAECDAGYSLAADATSCRNANPQACEVEHCNTCVSGDSTRCTSCDAGYYVSNGKCLAVRSCYVSNCAQCMMLDNTKCSTCMNGYLITSSYRCVSQNVINGAAAPHSLWMAAAVLLASVATCLA